MAVPTTNVNYRLLNSKGEVLDHKKNMACYFDLLSSPMKRWVKVIETYINIKHSPYDEEQVKNWIEVLNRLNFKCFYNGIKENCYEFSLKMSDYKQKLHLGSTLILIRYLWEHGLNSIPKYFFKIMKEVEGISEWEAIQLAHTPREGRNAYGNDNHTIRNLGHVQSFLEEKDFWDKVKDCSLYSHARPFITSSWQGEKDIYDIVVNEEKLDTNNLIETYSFIKENL